MSKLYEITIVAYKHFYVGAESQEKALEHEAVQDEEMTNFSGKVEWEHDETRAEEVHEKRAEQIRKHSVLKILKAE